VPATKVGAPAGGSWQPPGVKKCHRDQSLAGPSVACRHPSRCL